MNLGPSCGGVDHCWGKNSGNAGENETQMLPFEGFIGSWLSLHKCGKSMVSRKETPLQNSTNLSWDFHGVPHRQFNIWCSLSVVLGACIELVNDRTLTDQNLPYPSKKLLEIVWCFTTGSTSCATGHPQMSDHPELSNSTGTGGNASDSEMMMESSRKRSHMPMWSPR